MNNIGVIGGADGTTQIVVSGAASEGRSCGSFSARWR